MAKNQGTGAASYVTKLDLSLADKLREKLIEQGFSLSKPQYTLFSAKKKGVSCTLYQSGKLLVQGKEKEDFIRYCLEPEILQSFSYGYEEKLNPTNVDLTQRIGIDESGKGDFFGPLCIAGVCAGGEEIDQLSKLGVKDSKSLNDKQIRRIAAGIRKNHTHHIVRINPAKYNTLYSQFKNLNSLLAWGHSTAIEQLVEETDCRKVVVDQFASEWVVERALKRKQLEVELTQRHRAEEDLVVAAASILARAAFLDGLDRLEKQFDLKFPKGASRQVIETGCAFVLRFGSERLNEAGKLHFKTHQDILVKTA